MPCDKLLDFLAENGVEYQLSQHPLSYTAQETADRAHVSGKQFAKTVMVKLDGRMAMVVLPAHERVSLALFRDVAGAQQVELADEGEFRGLFPDCDLGAMPPFGNLYGMAVYACGSLAEQEQIAFNAGRHTEIITMRYADFERLVKPRVAQFARHRPRERDD